jgi:hypothetical protein
MKLTRYQKRQAARAPAYLRDIAASKGKKRRKKKDDRDAADQFLDKVRRNRGTR